MNVIHYHKGEVETQEIEVVREFPLALKVNGRELATLIASPHELRFLVAGFLRLQGFVRQSSDFHMLSVCEDFGMANVQIKGELPERLKPTLTSGCGTGITFNIPAPSENRDVTPPGRESFPVAGIFTLMEELARKAENYKAHGGIHSAAVGDDQGIILYAEDIGRHNTLDRIAGEALLKGINLEGKALVTSGRVSSEMIAKAMVVGISLIASRTSPTDMAIKLSEEAGITLVGYVRGGKFTVYSHPQRLGLVAKQLISDMTAVILAGGTSMRMGSNKALLPFGAGLLIEAVYRQLRGIFAEVILVTNTPEQYQFLPCRKVADLYPGMGALAGLHAGIFHSTTPAVFAVACDMPFLNEELIRFLASKLPGFEAVVPCSPTGQEPLHAVYGKECLPEIENFMADGRKKILDVIPRFNTREISASEVRLLDPDFSSFININTPEEFHNLGLRAEHT
jgi:FdhD protein